MAEWSVSSAGGKTYEPTELSLTIWLSKLATVVK